MYVPVTLCCGLASTKWISSRRAIPPVKMVGKSNCYRRWPRDKTNIFSIEKSLLCCSLLFFSKKYTVQLWYIEALAAMLTLKSCQIMLQMSSHLSQWLSHLDYGHSCNLLLPVVSHMMLIGQKPCVLPPVHSSSHEEIFFSLFFCLFLVLFFDFFFHMIIQTFSYNWLGVCVWLERSQIYILAHIIHLFTQLRSVVRTLYTSSGCDQQHAGRDTFINTEQVWRANEDRTMRLMCLLWLSRDY